MRTVAAAAGLALLAASPTLVGAALSHLGALEPWEIEQFDKRFAATPYAPLAALEVARTHDVRLFKSR